MKKNARQLIMKTALHLFYKQGVNNTGISQIIAESGVARASFYNNFKSKDDLIKACLKQYSNDLITLFRTFMNQTDTFEDFVQKWVTSIKSMEKAGFLHGCPMANIAFSIDAHDKRFSAAFSSAMQDWYLLLDDYFTGMQKKGQLAEKADVKILAKRIMLAYEGVFTMWKMTGDTELFDDLITIMPGLLKMDTGSGKQ